MTLKHFTLVLILNLSAFSIFAQQDTLKGNDGKIILPASTKYYKSEKYQKRWGEHYRKEWHTPVLFNKVNLDTLAGGLIPYELGGGRQTKSLKLRDANNREYVLRSIDKDLGKALPEMLRGTVLEDFVNDQASFAHPYGALVVAPLAEAAGIYHSNPAIFYVPSQSALKNFNDSSGNILYLFEQRADEDWSTAANFGYSKKIISTEKLLEELLEENDITIDQEAYVRARLFDMIIGDWGKHEDQWRWASFKNDNKTLYVPIPRDRDNVFTKFDGSLVNMAKSIAGAKHLQTFTAALPDPATFNFQARHLDRHLTNKLSLKDWLKIAGDLKNKITDNIIDNAVKQMPPEVYPLSGPEIAASIKSRRTLVETYAKNYFMVLAEEVEITGTKKQELVEIKKLSPTETQVLISILPGKGKTTEAPHFSRVFNSAETKEIRFYGIDGNDQYKISGDGPNDIRVRLIGGPGTDEYEDLSGSGSKNVHIYDDKETDVPKSNSISAHLSNDTSVHRYQYDLFKADKQGFSPKMFYTNQDRFYIGIGYKIQRQKWRKEPFAEQHKIDLKYSFPQNAISSTYEGIFKSVIGKWDLNFYANYDQVRWKNFFGLGNSSELTTEERDYNRVRSEQFIGKIGVQRVFNNRHRITINPYFQSYDVIHDSDRYLAKQPAIPDSGLYKANIFGGGEFEYLYQRVDDSILPVKGFHILTYANFSQNLEKSNRSVLVYGVQASAFIPVVNKFGISIKTGVGSLIGDPEFYQYNTVGGTENLRGHQRDRFYGNSMAYAQNEFRWISNVRSHYYSGKIGLFAFYDVGRVWLDGEESNEWHTGYGPGLLLTPFNKITVGAAYGFSKEDTNIHIYLKKAL